MIKFSIQTLQEGKAKKVGPFYAPSNPHEVTLRKYVDFKLKIQSTPSWFQQIHQVGTEDSASLVAKWTPNQWIEYSQIQAEIVSLFTDAPYDLIFNLKMYQKGKGIDSLQALYNQCVNVIAMYHGASRTYFEYKGDRYQLPNFSKNSNTSGLPGNKLRVIEAIEAMQAEKIYTSTDKEGNFVLKDYEFHVDIAVVASICRKVDDNGQPESIPVEGNEWDDFFAERCKHLEELPYTYAKDVFFFISNLKKLFKTTPLLSMLSPLLQVRANLGDW